MQIQEIKKTVTIEQVQEMLVKGLSRKQIKEQLGLSSFDMKYLFSFPELKGRKSLKQPSIVVLKEGEEYIQSLENLKK